MIKMQSHNFRKMTLIQNMGINLHMNKYLNLILKKRRQIIMSRIAKYD